ncbi:unnamed protein product [Rotaria magnacalcarata]|uniref:Uncharacterized protein n=3 Tax=Rotaria magnacalcarata TaxID=392030 RepID=A0A816GNL1_9BILA|nr:unnamed protein product [Rotaria magnacalcarata]CAF1676872.1 unnamed protein product [Rotaria magnacalcarata]CAF4016993.1 unnamed protein product [Rotaria magnacalcarata]
MVPTVHIVGTPPIASQFSGAILHRTLGNGDCRVFANMYKEITIVQANLTSKKFYRGDRSFSYAIVIFFTMINTPRYLFIVFSALKGRPVYISLSVDLSDYEINIDSSSIKPHNLSILNSPKVDHQAAALQAILDLVKKAENIIAIVAV